MKRSRKFRRKRPYVNPIQNAESVELNFGTWNIRGGLDLKINEILDAAKKTGIKILTLSETKKKGVGKEQLDGFVHIYSGKKRRHAAQGVSVLISDEFKNNIIKHTAVSKRILTVKLKLYGYNLCVVAIYGPTENDLQQEKNIFFKNLRETLSALKDSQENGETEVILLGDFNARIGKKVNDRIVGPHGEKSPNRNGHRLIELCTEYNLKIQNGFFKHPETQYTFRHGKNKKHQSIIDYGIKEDTTWTVKNVETVKDVTCGTDHFLVKMAIKIPIPERRDSVILSEDLANLRISSRNPPDIVTIVANIFNAVKNIF
ncbi:craniofacial development protein 2-like [Sitophilus oryzae]|uniref:Craniofacial development protein 2-like n=1 Tax=Sitophilus oryzae TaxID=7048 RepID=A0A6J2YE68_SITOR|nr:craniofacial development protein 2-like [Sitophilus oryzae]